MVWKKKKKKKNFFFLYFHIREVLSHSRECGSRAAFPGGSRMIREGSNVCIHPSWGDLFLVMHMLTHNFAVDAHVMHVRMPNIPAITYTLIFFRWHKQASLSRYMYLYTSEISTSLLKKKSPSIVKKIIEVFGQTKSADPDQTAPWGFKSSVIRVCNICSDLSLPILKVILAGISY